MIRLGDNEVGVTLVELSISLVIFSLVALSSLSLFISLVHSAIVEKRVSVATTLATNQMEYLKSLSYDSLAVAGGSIYSANPLPASSTIVDDGISYNVNTAINYVDDAYDGCGNYPNPNLKQLYCRNYPPPSSAPSVDANPEDYKVVHVTVTDSSGIQLAALDTDMASQVAETASSTGALFINVLDSNGAPLSGATVSVINNSLSPTINLSDATDVNGYAIFYGLPPDSNYDYKLTASKTGYSTLTTIPPQGSLQPIYSNQRILTQQSSYIALTIKLQGTNSLIVETTDPNGVALSGVKPYIKGGYKNYTSATDTSYYFDNQQPSDSRPTTDNNGLAAVLNLVPGPYTFCGDNGDSGCTIGGTKYYLAAAVPYGGINPFNPITVPIYDPANPPATTFTYNNTAYLQKVRLILTTSSTFPRISSLSPNDVSLSSSTISNFSFAITGLNLPCSATANQCTTTVKFKEASNTFTASCTGSNTGTQLNCSVNLSTATAGNLQLIVTANGNTFTLPDSPLLGGLHVTP